MKHKISQKIIAIVAVFALIISLCSFLTDASNRMSDIDFEYVSSKSAKSDIGFGSPVTKLPVRDSVLYNGSSMELMDKPQPFRGIDVLTLFFVAILFAMTYMFLCFSKNIYVKKRYRLLI